jgi:outer membrane cobalamin receptor
LNLNFFYEGLNINLNANLVGSRDDFRAASPFGDIIMPGYGIFDLASSYTLPWQFPGVKALALIGKVENLVNKKYEEADGFRARPLNFLLGIRATFGS